jgi:group I intron endonuclease
MANSGIYIIQNTKTGYIYIGQAINIPGRWMGHKRSLLGNKHNNRHLQAAWNQYGAKVFKFRVLEYCSREKLNEREQHFLNVYTPKGICYNISRNTHAPKKGYSRPTFQPQFSDYEILSMLKLYGTVKRVSKMIGASEDKLFEYLQAQGLAI